MRARAWPTATFVGAPLQMIVVAVKFMILLLLRKLNEDWRVHWRELNELLWERAFNEQRSAYKMHGWFNFVAMLCRYGMLCETRNSPRDSRNHFEMMSIVSGFVVLVASRIKKRSKKCRCELNMRGSNSIMYRMNIYWNTRGVSDCCEQRRRPKPKSIYHHQMHNALYYHRDSKHNI